VGGVIGQTRQILCWFRGSLSPILQLKPHRRSSAVQRVCRE